LDQLYEDLEIETIRTYALSNDTNLFALGQVRLFEHNRGHLSRIIVNPSSRGKGIGQAFVQKLVNEARLLDCQTITLHVVKENAIAIDLYKKLGFIIPARQPGNLRDGIFYMELG
jgi:ribosomal protein S18 acetylase RimI-like enzyme